MAPKATQQVEATAAAAPALPDILKHVGPGPKKFLSEDGSGLQFVRLPGSTRFRWYVQDSSKKAVAQVQFSVTYHGTGFQVVPDRALGSQHSASHLKAFLSRHELHFPQVPALNEKYGPLEGTYMFVLTEHKRFPSEDSSGKHAVQEKWKVLLPQQHDMTEVNALRQLKTGVEFHWVESPGEANSKPIVERLTIHGDELRMHKGPRSRVVPQPVGVVLLRWNTGLVTQCIRYE